MLMNGALIAAPHTAAYADDPRARADHHVDHRDGVFRRESDGESAKTATGKTGLARVILSQPSRLAEMSQAGFSERDLACRAYNGPSKKWELPLRGRKFPVRAGHAGALLSSNF